MGIKIKIGWHKDAKQFRKVIGKSYTRSGRLAEKVWFLGADENAAVNKAMLIAEAWEQLNAQGGKYWTQDVIDRLNGNTTAAIPSAEMTVGAVKDAYLAELKERMVAKQITASHYRGQKNRLESALEICGRFMPPARPMKSIGEGEIRMAVLALCQRPFQKRKRQIGMTHASNLIKTLKWFLTWSHELNFWDQPKRFRRLFMVRITTTDAEKKTRLEKMASPEPMSYSLAELKAIWDAAMDARHRCWILLAMNCSFGPMELATLKRWEVKTAEDGSMYIERFRQKTSVYGRWKLWDETAMALRAVMEKDGELALLTRTKTPLIEETETERRDAISQSWRWIQRRSGVKGGFKTLRKTSATMAKAIGGLEVSEMMLAHIEHGQNKAYCGRRWEMLDHAIGIMRTQLQDIFMAALKLADAA